MAINMDWYLDLKFAQALDKTADIRNESFSSPRGEGTLFAVMSGLITSYLIRN